MSQPAALREQGPIVWGGMDQRALDDAYDQTVYAANMPEVAKRRAVEAARVRALLKPERVAYGASEIEKLDIYRAPRPNAPIAIFIHGGAWRQRPALEYGVQAEMLTRAGVAHVVPDFAGVETVGGDLMKVAAQIRAAIVWTCKNAANFGGDASRLYLFGHSSGAHMAGVMATTDWTKHGLPAKIFAGVMTCSGMYDLAPVRLSKRSEYVAFTDEIERELSSQRHLERLNAPLVVGYGTCESPEFQRQGRDVFAAVKATGKPVELVVGEGFNHFEIFETMANPYGLLGRAALKMIGV